jgi:phospholipid/cholesterol/gamma-HCH transport system substrate-binding protein
VPALGALVAAFVLAAVGIVVVLGGGGYKVHALFSDASQLVNGDLVEVGGKPVGKVHSISLTPDNQADIELRITDDRYKPLHDGTVARVRQVGAIGVTNRFIELEPGASSAAEISDGGTLPESATRPNVDLDMLFNALTPDIRAKVKLLIRKGAVIFDGRTQSANRTFAYLNPAFGQLRAVADELASDTTAFDRLISSSSDLVTALASRRADLQQGIGNTSTTLNALADVTGALGDTIERAPAAMRQGVGTLGRLNQTLAVLNPALTELQPSAAPLARLLRLLPSTTRDATPALAQLHEVLPPTIRTLKGLPALARVAVPALGSASTAIRAAQPIFSGLRPYTPEIVMGLTNSFGGATSGYYDANGHFTRISPQVNSGPGTTSGVLSLVPNLGAGSFNGYRTGLTARCPGAAMEAAADGSNPWVADPAVCDPKDSHP